MYAANIIIPGAIAFARIIPPTIHAPWVLPPVKSAPDRPDRPTFSMLAFSIFVWVIEFIRMGY